MRKEKDVEKIYIYFMSITLFVVCICVVAGCAEHIGIISYKACDTICSVGMCVWIILLFLFSFIGMVIEK